MNRDINNRQKKMTNYRWEFIHLNQSFLIEIDGTRQKFHIVCVKNHEEKERHSFHFTKTYFPKLKKTIYEGLSFLLISNLVKSDEIEEVLSDTKIVTFHIEKEPLTLLKPIVYCMQKLNKHLAQGSIQKEDEIEIQRFIVVLIKKMDAHIVTSSHETIL